MLLRKVIIYEAKYMKILMNGTQEVATNFILPLHPSLISVL
jgi:hypothetical protein